MSRSKVEIKPFGQGSDQHRGTTKLVGFLVTAGALHRLPRRLAPET
jgi:hypothetical protein